MDIEKAFKLFDIRGQYGVVVDERLAFVVGKALVKMKKCERVLVAMDTRESSPPLHNFLIDGLSTNCREICDLYEAPIPQFYYTMVKGKYDLGVMVTASHIDSSENGFKVAGLNGMPFDEGEISDLKNLVTTMKDEQIIVPKSVAKRISSIDKYIEDIIKISGISAPKAKLVLDAGKSSVLTPALNIFSQIGSKFTMVKSEHGNNPLLNENQRALSKEIIATKSDLGIMWDSDGDRAVFLDRNGKMIPMSFVLGILAADAIGRGPGKKIVADVRAGLVVRDLVIEAGGTLEVLPAWSTFIKFAMRDDEQIVFGGETSGHFTFPDFYKIDDGLLASLRFLAIFEKGDLEERLASLKKKYFELPEKNISVKTGEGAKILQKIAEHFRSKHLEVSVVDGVTVFGEDFKLNLRESLTESLLRLNLEAKSDLRAREIEKEIERFL